MADTSDARWFRGSFGTWGSHGSWGGWGSHGTWGGGGSRGTWGGWGTHGSWGSHGGWGTHGSFGGWGTHGSWGSHGGHAVGFAGDVYASRGVVRGGVIASRPQRERFVASAPQAAPEPATRTRLTLHVPPDAKVTLAGVTTRQTGEVRQFATSRLNSGQVWDDYQVVVELERDGQVLREEKMIRLIGGESQELRIDMDATQLAQR